MRANENLIREKIQEEAKKIAIENNRRGILHISMGVGKTKIGISLIRPDERVLVVAPYKSTIQSWKEEFKKWNISDKNVVYTTTASLKKFKDIKFDLVIADEIHLFSGNQLSLLTNKSTIGLSGTISESSEKIIKEITGLDIIYEYTLEEAIRDKIITDYRITIVEVLLDNTEKYIQAGTKKKPFLTTEKDYYDFLTKKFNQFKSAEWFSVGSEKKKYTSIKMQFASKRAKLLYSCKSKIEAAKKVIDSLKNERILIFTTLTDTANQLAEHQYHSKSDKHNLDLFSSGQIDKLAVVNMANVGLNIKPLHTAVVHQFQSSEETAQQRMGRLLRLEYENPNKIANIVVICAVNTVDEQWVKSALKGIPKEKIRYVHYKNL